ncbi:MAG: Bifunctional protein GlmU [Candidatus Roizmanbacteria bacterium GW2011_GWC2_41_7]|uniref:Bifunctional protein GlmU n=1 Tax=Candidatus Roizmanbacteria bacterium GW2011_GWC2_41_7 TaxID=1618487 RepID=A0A0G0ZLF6_9BACT|nr:MAG: Bifunctional protein GlmU [Candidatus Roizmanbacteria bacterium GW2011_GWC2_41_7]
MDKVSAIILAAGKGTRMRSTEDSNKAMLHLDGKPMVSYTVENMRRSGISNIVMVVGYAKESIMDYFKNTVQYVVQEEQLGTAHALSCGLKLVPSDHQTIISVYGDDSYTYPAVLYQKMIDIHHSTSADVTLLTVYLDDPSGLGRIVRDSTEHVMRIHEVNTGCYVFNRSFLDTCLPQIKNENAAHEYYVTDIIRLAVKNGNTIADVRETNLRWRGVNSPEELEEARKIIT